MKDKRITKSGVTEADDDPRWQSPSHQVSIEIDNPRGGTYRKSVAEIKSAKIFGGHIRGQLTDHQIQKYLDSGWYQLQRMFRENREKKLVWDAERQEFELR